MGSDVKKEVIKAKMDEFGDYTYTSYSGNDYLYASVAHSGYGGALGLSLVDGGHCLPRIGHTGYVTCKSEFNIGELAIDFYIANPKKN